MRSSLGVCKDVCLGALHHGTPVYNFFVLETLADTLHLQKLMMSAAAADSRQQRALASRLSLSHCEESKSTEYENSPLKSNYFLGLFHVPVSRYLWQTR